MAGPRRKNAINKNLKWSIVNKTVRYSLLNESFFVVIFKNVPEEPFITERTQRIN